MRKIDLKDVFYNTNSQGTQEVPSFQIGVKPFRISLNVFRPWPSPAPFIFIKLTKVPIALLRRLNRRLIIYLDNMPISIGKVCTETNLFSETQ